MSESPLPSPGPDAAGQAPGAVLDEYPYRGEPDPDPGTMNPFLANPQTD